MHLRKADFQLNSNTLEPRKRCSWNIWLSCCGSSSPKWATGVESSKDIRSLEASGFKRPSHRAPAKKSRLFAGEFPLRRRTGRHYKLLWVIKDSNIEREIKKQRLAQKCENCVETVQGRFTTAARASGAVRNSKAPEQEAGSLKLKLFCGRTGPSGFEL